jgi:uncharacterized membrane protein
VTPMNVQTQPAPVQAPAQESRSRSLAKAVSWRMTGTIDTMVISFIITGQLKLAISIGFVELFTKIMLYYVHERIWDKIRFGRARHGRDSAQNS